MARIYNRSEEKQKRRELRNNMPKAEVLLWCKLKGRQLLGYKFRRQYSFGQYVVDFYCPALRLAVKVDGDSHFVEGAEEKDRTRSEYIGSFGIRIVRFLNTDIYENMDGVLETLVKHMSQNPPNPPYPRGEEYSAQP